MHGCSEAHKRTKGWPDMPGKPSRKDRRRTGGGAQSRPKPAPAVRTARPLPPTEESTPEEQLEPQAEAPIASGPVDAAPVQRRQPGSRPVPVAERQESQRTLSERAGLPSVRPGSRRPGGTASARAVELQREQRIRRDTVHDLKVTAVVAGIAIAMLIAVAALS